MRINHDAVARILRAEKIVRAYREIEKENTPKPKERPARRITYGSVAAKAPPSPEEQNAVHRDFWSKRD